MFCKASLEKHWFHVPDKRLNIAGSDKNKIYVFPRGICLRLGSAWVYGRSTGLGYTASQFARGM